MVFKMSKGDILAANICGQSQSHSLVLCVVPWKWSKPAGGSLARED